MADEVGLQTDVTISGNARARTLHLKTLRKQWQIIALQIVATVALVGMYLKWSLHMLLDLLTTMLFDSIELLIGDQLPLNDWFWRRRNGLARFLFP